MVCEVIFHLTVVSLFSSAASSAASTVSTAASPVIQSQIEHPSQRLGLKGTNSYADGVTLLQQRRCDIRIYLRFTFI